tara:strand:+ start:240 stop:467 length:228 start_codon:yes stop_codon:yes gene_type:complete
MAKQKKGGRPAILALTAGIGKKVAKAKPASVKAGRATTTIDRRSGAARRRSITKSVKQSSLTKGVASRRRWEKKR